MALNNTSLLEIPKLFYTSEILTARTHFETLIRVVVVVVVFVSGCVTLANKCLFLLCLRCQSFPYETLIDFHFED